MKSCAVILVILALVVGIGYGGWRLLVLLFDWLMALPSPVAASITISGSALLAGLLLATLMVTRAQSRALVVAQQPLRAKLFGEFISTVAEVLRENRGETMLNEIVLNRLEEYFDEITPQLILLGSPNVIVNIVEYRKECGRQNADALILLDELLQSMRADLGMSNWLLESGELVRLLLNDPKPLDTRPDDDD